MKKQKNVNNRQKKKQSVETDQQVAQRSELADRNFKIAIANMLKKLQEKIHTVSKEMGEFQRRCKNYKRTKWKC